MEICLDRLSFHARHGVLPQERETGGHFLVSLRLQIDEADAADALAADRLEGTVNYAEVYDLVRREMEQPSALLERVAARLAAALVRRFSKLREVEVEVTKRTPPIAGFDGAGIRVVHRLRRSLTAWDFDGTIADTSAGIVRTMTATFGQMGWRVPSPAEICATIGLPLLDSIERLAGVSGEELRRAADCYHDLFEQIGTEGVTLFPGVADEMARQHALGRFVGIATSRGHASADALCRRLGIRDYVDHIVACEDVAAHKPDPAPVLRLCELTHVCPADVTVIGDTTFDIEMGRNAGVGRCIGVGWGNHTPDQLRAAGADLVVDHF